MKKIVDLHQFIISLGLVDEKQINSYVDDLVITPGFRFTAQPAELIASEKSYIATFYIEDYPHGVTSEDALLAQICAWLIENDPTRLEAMEFPMTVVINDTQTADLEFGIPFREDVLVKEDPAGLIYFNGLTYALA